MLLRPFHHAFWGRRGIGMMADGGHHGEGEHDERDVAMPAMPGTGLIVVEAEFVFAVSKLSSIAQRCPSTFTSFLIGVPAGHHVEK